jgi:hypothetical protein
MASFANTTVFVEERTITGIGRYCIAAKASSAFIWFGGMRIASEARRRDDGGERVPSSH